MAFKVDATSQSIIMSTISSILQDSLDLIGNGGNDGPANSDNKTTASATLLAEKRQRQQNAALIENLGDFVPIRSLNPTAGNPFLDQIASSTTEPPTYWKSNNSSSHGGGSGSSAKARAVKSSSTLTMISKAKSAKMKKGEDYNDRLSSKLQKRGFDPLSHLKSKKKV